MDNNLINLEEIRDGAMQLKKVIRFFDTFFIKFFW